MEQLTRAIQGRWQDRVGVAFVPILIALATGGLGSACLAADSISSLGSAFRPQAGGAATTAGGAEGGSGAGSTLPGLRVIVTGPAHTVASIDGEIVRVGDSVNGMRVTQINPQGVVLVSEDGAQERLMINPVVKRMRPADTARAPKGARQ